MRIYSRYFLFFASGALLSTTFLRILPGMFESKPDVQWCFAFLLAGLVLAFVMHKCSLVSIDGGLVNKLVLVGLISAALGFLMVSWLIPGIGFARAGLALVAVLAYGASNVTVAKEITTCQRRSTSQFFRAWGLLVLPTAAIVLIAIVVKNDLVHQFIRVLPASLFLYFSLSMVLPQLHFCTTTIETVNQCLRFLGGVLIGVVL